MRTLPLIIISCLCALVSPLAGQTSITMDLGQGGETIADALVFTDGELNATATAWSQPVAGGTFRQAELVQWSPGIGTKSEGEVILNVPFVPFYVDNEDSYDFVLFVFDRPVEIDRLKIHPSGKFFDLDVSYWFGNIDPDLNLGGSGFSDLSSFGFGSRIDDDGVVTNRSRWVDMNSNTGGLNALLVGARVDGDSNYDRFKIQTLEVTALAVPEPSALVLLGAAVPLLLRRKRAA